jgi:hypothetical protein
VHWRPASQSIAELTPRSGRSFDNDRGRCDSALVGLGNSNETYGRGFRKRPPSISSGVPQVIADYMFQGRIVHLVPLNSYFLPAVVANMPSDRGGTAESGGSPLGPVASHRLAGSDAALYSSQLAPRRPGIRGFAAPTDLGPP